MCNIFDVNHWVSLCKSDFHCKILPEPDSHWIFFHWSDYTLWLSSQPLISILINYLSHSTKTLTLSSFYPLGIRKINKSFNNIFTFITPYFEHSSATSPYKLVSASSIIFNNKSTLVAVFFIIKDSSINSLIGMSEVLMIAELLLVFWAIRGVFIPC